ncbi:MAG: hypothetical protein M1281_04645 [Chloroflexi bacterium]|nr:hypothetical protein [Chloroflexota bacterium]
MTERVEATLGELLENFGDKFSLSLSPEESWQYCLWNCDDGLMKTNLPLTPQSWQDLVKKANSITLDRIPHYLQTNPNLYYFLF